MTMQEIKDLPIGELAADNCALLMWCTFPKLDEQIKLFEHWGFRYCTIAFDWVKTNKKNGFPFFGTGFYTKSNAEVCLLGVNGSMRPASNKISNVLEDFEPLQIIAPINRHSKKPPEAKQKIVELFGDIPRLEMFAREKTPGWDCWGNEVDCDINLNLQAS